MLISTYTGDREIRIQTVSLRKNFDNPNQTFGFYCTFCGESLCKVQGEVTKITPGLEPTGQAVERDRDTVLNAALDEFCASRVETLGITDSVSEPVAEEVAGE